MSATLQCRPRPTLTRVGAFLGDDSTTISQLPPALRTAVDQRERLLHLIADQQKVCRSYLAKAKPRLATLTFVNLAAGALATAVAAGPALGGSSLLDTFQARLNIGDEDLLYQVICAVAFVMSLISVITANIIRAYDYSARVAAVEGCCSELDSLRIRYCSPPSRQHAAPNSSPKRPPACPSYRAKPAYATSPPPPRSPLDDHRLVDNDRPGADNDDYVRTGRRSSSTVLRFRRWSLLVGRA